MPNGTILGHLGFFVRRGLLSPELCRLIRGEMAAATRAPAMVRPVGEATGVVDERTRRTGIASVSASTRATIDDHLLATKPSLEHHFGVRLSGWQRPVFYVYEEGDFFTPHRDRDAEDPAAPDWIKARQVSVSVLLNDGQGGTESESYTGGSMVFHGRRSDGTFAIPLES